MIEESVGLMNGTPETMAPALPPELVDTIRAELESQGQQDFLADIEARKSELHAHLKRWLARCMIKRRAEKEDKWNRYRRNSKSIYDPAKSAEKEAWQSKVFIPISLQQKEIIKAQLHKTIIQGLPYSMKPRPSGTLEQASSIKELLLRELQRCRFESKSDNVFDDVTTYGVGFMKWAWVNEEERRSVRQPTYEPMSIEVLQRAQLGVEPRIVGYERVMTTRLVYRGIRAWWVSIWDLFFDTDASDFDTCPKAHRVRLSFQEILNNIREGFYFQESASKIKDTQENKSLDEDKQEMRADEHKIDESVPSSRNERQITGYEYFGKLPKKWVYLRPEEQHLVDDPEELVPAKAVFCAEALFDVAENERYDGRSPFSRAVYIDVPGSIYGMGIMEMLEQIQDDLNEGANQRKDNVSLILNRMFAILEKAIVSPKDLVSRPGGGIRIKSTSTDDVRKGIMWLDTPDVTKSSYQETLDSERFAQELTGATRVTIGSGGQDTGDITDTYGGMQILRNIANERLGYHAAMIESGFITSILKSFYAEIYANITPDELIRILGPERVSTFQLLTPEEVEQDYQYAPEGVFSNVYKPSRTPQWLAFREAFKGNPWFNDLAMAQQIAAAIDLPQAHDIIVPIKDPLTGEEIPFEQIQQMNLAAQAQQMQQENNERPKQ